MMAFSKLWYSNLKHFVLISVWLTEDDFYEEASGVELSNILQCCGDLAINKADVIEKVFNHLLEKIEEVDLYNLSLALTSMAKLNLDVKYFNKISEPLVIKLREEKV